MASLPVEIVQSGSGGTILRRNIQVLKAFAMVINRIVLCPCLCKGRQRNQALVGWTICIQSCLILQDRLISAFCKALRLTGWSIFSFHSDKQCSQTVRTSQAVFFFSSSSFLFNAETHRRVLADLFAKYM